MEQKLQKLYEEVISLRERLLAVWDENPEVRELLHASDCLKQSAGFMAQVLNR